MLVYIYSIHGAFGFHISRVHHFIDRISSIYFWPFAGFAVPFRSGRADLGPFRSVLPRSMWCGSRPVKLSPAFRDSPEMQMGGVVGQCMR